MKKSEYFFYLIFSLMIFNVWRELLKISRRRDLQSKCYVDRLTAAWTERLETRPLPYLHVSPWLVFVERKFCFLFGVFHVRGRLMRQEIFTQTMSHNIKLWWAFFWKIFHNRSNNDYVITSCYGLLTSCLSPSFRRLRPMRTPNRKRKYCPIRDTRALVWLRF